jgi:hypothetical protein
VAVALGTLLEGGLVGFAQGRVIRRYTPDVSVARWTGATAIGAALAWILGMVPSTAIALLQEDTVTTAAPATEPTAIVQYTLAAVLGVVLGVVLAGPQMIVLRQVTSRPKRWLGANALAWGIGMPLIFVGMDLLPWGGSMLVIAAGATAVCFAVGAVVGAVHGLFLRRMLEDLPPPVT